MSSDDTQPADPIVEQPVVEQPVVADPPAAAGGSALKALRVLSLLVIVAGVILVAAGAVTWVVVANELSDEKVVVSDDAERFAGEPVDGPLTAYSEAETIQKHALEASGGKTYAELEQDDPVRQTVMTASFLRSSLFTSVVSFGVAAFAAGVGILMILIGYILLRLSKVVGTLQQASVRVT